MDATTTADGALAAWCWALVPVRHALMSEWSSASDARYFVLPPIELFDGPNVLGRASFLFSVLPPTVSREHARFTLEREGGAAQARVYVSCDSKAGHVKVKQHAADDHDAVAGAKRPRDESEAKSDLTLDQQARRVELFEHDVVLIGGAFPMCLRWVRRQTLHHPHLLILPLLSIGAEHGIRASDSAACAAAAIADAMCGKLAATAVGGGGAGGSGKGRGGAPGGAPVLTLSGACVVLLALEAPSPSPVAVAAAYEPVAPTAPDAERAARAAATRDVLERLCAAGVPVLDPAPISSAAGSAAGSAVVAGASRSCGPLWAVGVCGASQLARLHDDATTAAAAGRLLDACRPPCTDGAGGARIDAAGGAGSVRVDAAGGAVRALVLRADWKLGGSRSCDELTSAVCASADGLQREALEANKARKALPGAPQQLRIGTVLPVPTARRSGAGAAAPSGAFTLQLGRLPAGGGSGAVRAPAPLELTHVAFAVCPGVVPGRASTPAAIKVFPPTQAQLDAALADLRATYDEVLRWFLATAVQAEQGGSASVLEVVGGVGRQAGPGEPPKSGSYWAVATPTWSADNLSALAAYVRDPHLYPGAVLSYDARFVCVRDRFPKGRVHLLILPRAGVLAGAAGSPCSNVGELRPCHLAELEALSRFADAACERVGPAYAAWWASSHAGGATRTPPPLGPLWRGFHAKPSLTSHVHMHIVSGDLAGESLKSLTHYNSFTRPQLFIPLSVVRAKLATPTLTSYSELMFGAQALEKVGAERPPACHRCGKDDSSGVHMPTTKSGKEWVEFQQHLEGCTGELPQRA